MKLLISALGLAMSFSVWANMPAPIPAPAPVVVPASIANTVSTLPPEVKEEIILNNPSNLQALQTLLGPELIPAGAAQTSSQPETQLANGRSGRFMLLATAGGGQTAVMTAGRKQIQVRPGETLDRILARTLGATPFAPALVRKTVVEMNPTAFTGGSPHRLNANATLVLPSLQDLQAVAGGGSTGAALIHSPASGNHAHSQDDRRNWIRYP